jgi:hypothetical protein
MLHVGDIVEVTREEFTNILLIGVVEYGERGIYLLGFPMNKNKLHVYENEVKVIGHVEET